MLRMFRKPSGNVAIAMLLCVIGAMSGFTMSSLAMRDTIAFQYDFESIQSMMLLRSEAYRGQCIAQKLGVILAPVRTSKRLVPITNSAIKKTFEIQSMIVNGALTDVADDVVMGDQKQITSVKSLVKSKAGITQSSFFTGNYSMIRKYAEYTLESETFAKFMYFTDIEESTNETPVYFYGPDVLYGRVHSNQDIWIKQAGGGDNSGWPTFYGWVTTAGVIQSYSGAYPEEIIFRGGLAEEYPYTVFPEEASRIRRNGEPVGPPNFDPDNIMYVEVDGASFSTYLGTIEEPERDSSGVYSVFPPYIPANYLYTNNYQVSDTTWVQYSNGTANNKSLWVNGRLWLKGTFATYQTWGCADTLFLIDDILLAGTEKGTDPKDNHRDVLGLVSEKSIIVKYGYRSPVDSLRVHGNCEAAGSAPVYGGIWIYAAMAALGSGHGNPHADGVFSFEYQHPHPSVPDIIRPLNGLPYTFTKIDLHRFRFPQNNAYPWARQTTTTPKDTRIDYPWYNPLWPEARPYLERGYISIYGSISQRRRGFVHRSNFDQEYLNSGNIWNQPIDFCGGTSSAMETAHTLNLMNIPVNLGTMHYPGASGTGVGYQKNYHYDMRFYKTSPRDFPETSRRDGSSFAGVNWVIKKPPLTL